MYYSQGSVSQKMKTSIIYYYKELYDNYEIKTTGEIADDLGIDARTITRFLEIYYEGPNLDGVYPPLTTMIMLCTKFKSTSQFYEEQQNNFGEIIKKRAIFKAVKMRTQKLNEKRKVKRL